MTLRLLAAIVLYASVIFGAQAQDLLIASPVDQKDIKIFQYKGEKARVTHNVPNSLLGTYDLPPESLNFPQYARNITLSENGRGEAHQYGMNKDPEKFEWGLMEQDGKVHLFDWEGNTTAIVVMKWFNGNYGYNYLHVHNGRLAMVGPYSSKMYKD